LVEIGLGGLGFYVGHRCQGLGVCSSSSSPR
jgi:hypothetical protein